jgi:hypothetical protein
LPRYHAQVEAVILHFPDAGMNMKGYKKDGDYIEVFKNFLFMKQAIAPLSHKVGGMTMDRAGIVHPDFQSIISNLGAWQGHSRAGTLDEGRVEKLGAMVPPRIDYPVVCAKTPHYDQNVLFPNGDVGLCCMDFGMKHIIGNLLTSDYYDLFESPELMRVRLENMKPGFSSASLCKSCERALLSSERPCPI